MWCGKCYTSQKNLPFHVYSIAKEPGNEDPNPEERARLLAAWKPRLRNAGDFHEARNGDHLFIPFECDTCIFQKLQRRDPVQNLHVDQLLLGCIRCANLDAFWSRSRNTVNFYTNKSGFIVGLSAEVGLRGVFKHTGAFPNYNHCGYEVAINMLLYSCRPGKNDQSHTQFETIWKLRTVYGNFVRASPNQNLHNLCIVDPKGIYTRIVDDKCSSLWFHHFISGCQIRMGQVWKPNKAMSIHLLCALLEKAEDRYVSTEDPQGKHRWLVFITYAAVCYVISLRGVEGFMIDLDSINCF